MFTVKYDSINFEPRENLVRGQNYTGSAFVMAKQLHGSFVIEVNGRWIEVEVVKHDPFSLVNEKTNGRNRKERLEITDVKVWTTHPYHSEYEDFNIMSDGKTKAIIAKIEIDGWERDTVFTTTSRSYFHKFEQAILFK